MTTNSGTEFEHGTAADLALNVKVEVEGDINASGTVVADKVEFRVQPEDADVEIEGDIVMVDAATGAISIQDMNVAITVDAVTRFEDESSANDGSLALGDLNPGDHVKIRGAEDSATSAVNDMIATRLERKNASDNVELSGPVQAVNQPDLSILGVQVATDTAEFRGQDDVPIDQATFFATISTGDIVEARTTSDRVAGNVLDADRVEIEDD